MAEVLEHPEIAEEERELLKLIPGYDPFRGSEGYIYDQGRADRAVQFFERHLTHIKGDKARKALKLEPWQEAIVRNVFGWIDPETGYRRYRQVFIYIPRKNGKSTLATGLALLTLFTDREEGAECYLAAGARKQAGIIFDLCREMILRNPALVKRCNPQKKVIVRENLASKLEAVSAEGGLQHGGDSHFVCIDELHVQPDGKLVEALETSVGARRQPLIVYLTTADYNRASVCNDRLDQAIKVRDGIVPDPQFLPVVYRAEPDDDWHSEETWRKANPNYGVSVVIPTFVSEYKQACAFPNYENTFKRLRLNMTTEQETRVIPMADWEKCDGEIPSEEELRNTPCYCGLDLASVEDTTAFVQYWHEPLHYCRATIWVPEEHPQVEKRYKRWVDDGFISTTPGNIQDYEFIRAHINDVYSDYNVKSIGFDPHNGQDLAVRLQEYDGIEMTEFRQGYLSMSEPIKRLLGLIKAHKLNHGGNPVLKWMASNAAGKEDPDEHIKFVKVVKGQKTGKIDGMVALAIAVGLAIVDVGPAESIYESQGLDFV